MAGMDVYVSEGDVRRYVAETLPRHKRSDWGIDAMELCAAAGDKPSLANGMVGLVMEHMMHGREREGYGVDFINGMATALTPLAFFEVLMLKAFRRLVDDDAEVSIDTGLRAAEKLQAVLDKHDQGDEIADMRRQVNLILDAVKTTVPQEMWGALMEKIEEYEQPKLALDDETDDDDEGFDPSDCDDIDDEL